MKKIKIICLGIIGFFILGMLMTSIVKADTFSSNLSFVDIDNDSNNLTNKGNLINEATGTSNYRYEYEIGQYKQNSFLAHQLTSDDSISQVIQQEIDISDDNTFKMYDGNFSSGFSFDDDVIGSEPNGFYEHPNYTPYGQMSVISVFEGHDKVLKIDDTSTSGVYSIEMSHGNQESGTIEFWFATSDGTYNSDFYLGGASQYYLIIGICNDDFYYYDGTNQYLSINTVDNVWYHVRIDFECGNGGYMNLLADTYHLYINGVRYSNLPFWYVAESANLIGFKTGGATTYTHNIYADAIGFSYDVGFNYNGVDDNKIYDIMNEYGTEVKTLSNTMYSHENVISLVDNSGSLAKYGGINLQESISYGSIEFWFSMMTCVGSTGVFGLYSGSTLISYMDTWTSNFRIQYASGGVSALTPWHLHEWFHFKIDFELTSNAYLGMAQYRIGITINGHDYGDFTCINNQNSMDKIIFGSFITAGSTMICNIDAFGIYPYLIIETYDSIINFDNLTTDDLTSVDYFDFFSTAPQYWSVNPLYTEYYYNVLCLNQVSSGYILARCNYNFGNQGFFECWTKLSSSSLFGGSFEYHYNNEYTSISYSYIDLNWHRLSYIWNYDNSESYLGLNPNTAKVFIDGVQDSYVSSSYSASITPRLDIYGGVSSGQYQYFDNFGYSNENYELNDNNNLIDNFYYYDINSNLECLDGISYELGSNFQTSYVNNSKEYHDIIIIETYDFGLTATTDNEYLINTTIQENNIYLNIEHNTENILSINISQIELQYEFVIYAYYGKINGSLANQFNIKYILYENINNDTILYQYEHTEIVLDYVNTDGIRLQEFSLNDNLLLSQYDVNILSKLRVIMDVDLSREYTSFYNLFRINDDISIATIQSDDSGIPNGSYWTYTGYTLSFDYNETISTTNFELDYPLLVSNTITMYFPVNTVAFSYGNWYDVFLNALIFVLNLLILLLHLVLYVLVIAFNFIILWLIVSNIVILFWNIIIKYLIWCVMWMIDGLGAFIFTILPIFFQWFFETLLPILFDIIAYLLGIIIGTLLYILSGGNADLLTLINTITEVFNVIFDFVYEIIMFGVDEMLVLLLYGYVYIEVYTMLYGKYIYAEARGFSLRCKDIENSMNAMKSPIKTIREMIKGFTLR